MKTKLVSVLSGGEEFMQYSLDELKKKRIDTDDVSALIHTLTHGQKEAKIAAMDVLGVRSVKQSLPALKLLVRNRDCELSYCALVAIGRIAGSSESGLYADLLDDNKFREKSLLVSIIWEVGGEDSAEAMRRYAKKVVNGDALIGVYEDHLYIAEYLTQHSRDVSDMQLVDQLKAIYIKNNGTVFEKLGLFFKKKSDYKRIESSEKQQVEKYDDADWHEGYSIHIALMFVWLVQEGQAIEDESSRGLVDDVRRRGSKPSVILERYADNKLIGSMFTSEGNDFLKSNYDTLYFPLLEDGKNDLLRTRHEMPYNLVDSWTNVDVIAKMLKNK